MLDAIEGFLQYGFVQLEPIWSAQVSGHGLYIQCLGKTGGGKSCFTRQKGLWIIQQWTYTLDHLITTHINDLFVCKIMYVWTQRGYYKKQISVFSIVKNV